MPKMKTNRGAAKRLRITARGKVRRRRAMKRHILGKKSPKRKRRLSRPAILPAAEAGRMKRLLGV